MKPYKFLIPGILMLASCGGSDKSPKITGNVAGADSIMVSAYYDIDGDSYSEELYTDSAGNFTFDPQLTKGTDLTLYINGHSYGARIDNGTSVNIAIDSTGIATFSGDNLAESRWLNACFNGYDARRYKHIPDRDGAFVLGNYLAMIDDTRTSTDALLTEVANDSLRAYYSRLGEQFYNKTKGQLLMLEYYFNGRDNGAEYPTEVAALSMADPNDDVSRRTGAIYDWINKIPVDRQLPIHESIIAMSNYADSAISNQANRRAINMLLAEMLFSYSVPLETAKATLDKMGGRLSEHQLEQLGKHIAEIESRTKEGDKIPVDPELILPDGSKKLLSEACGGKVAYIDMWATWCGPCCAQIPYMEKIAEHYKDSDKVVCISISCDEDLDAWHKKLDQDNPAWPQYVFAGESGNTFQKALGVTAIPRFIILSPDLKIADLNAPRPQQQEKIIARIDSIAAL